MKSNEKKPISWRRRFAYFLLALIPALGIYTVAAGAVSNERTSRDLQAIATLQADPYCATINSFEDEIRCVRYVQNRLLTTAKSSLYKCGRWGEKAEPLDYLERGYGCCFDRARFMEKTFEHYGLETRYLSLHDPSKWGVLAYLAPGVNSHAAVEVATRRGWMGADTNKKFILLTRAGRPFTYGEIRSVPQAQMVDAVPQTRGRFFYRPLLITYGLYSRTGGHHGTDLPAPEINYTEFFKHNSFNIF